MTTDRPMLRQALDQARRTSLFRRIAANIRSFLAVYAFLGVTVGVGMGWPLWLTAACASYLPCWVMALPETGRRGRNG